MDTARHKAIPPLAPGRCQVWWAPTSAADPRLLALLDPHERDRHDGFLREADRARFLVAHALARIVAAEHAATGPELIRYWPGAAGRQGAGAKPRFADAAADLELSISHSGEHTAVALSRAAAVGVDVERIGPQAAEASLVESVLAAAEQLELGALPESARAWGFCRYWTRKEAILKATGDGLSVSLRRISVTGATRPPALLHWSGPGRPTEPVDLYDLDVGPGYTASLATVGVSLERPPSEHDGEPLLGGWR
ncbi:MAG TPA: 4'-phosphopantetheinyl transferase superfamily protein [Solirubrobacteraceae bacterium]|nr:4'-phosphopantetheinyl transferase superfamily protein [Solirubrobacteraceae bacterium]